MNSKGPWYLYTNNRFFQLYLTGIKGLFENRRKTGYNRNKKIILIFVVPYVMTKYLYYNCSTEFETLRYPNFLIPRFIYDARREHYVYWELSRLARKKNNMFSHYFYDTDTDFVFYITKEGQTTEKNNLNFEKLETIKNPLFEQYVRRYKETKCPESLKNTNLLIAYNKNMYNPLDLDNYLFYKTVNLKDWIRGFFWAFMLYTKLTNHYRYDHILAKKDYIYEYEKLKFSLNLPNKSLDNDKIKKYSLIYENMDSFIKFIRNN